MGNRSLLIWRKEIKDILRDRRTLISMILLPILLIPLFVVVPILIIHTLRTAQTEKESRLLYIGEEIPELVEFIKAEEKVRLYRDIRDSALAVQMIRNKEADGAILVALNFKENLKRRMENDSSSFPLIILLHDVTRDRSQIAHQKALQAVGQYQSWLIREVKERWHLPNFITEPFRYTDINVKGPIEMGRFGMGLWLPYFLILMLISGATYPALDLTAGEKERKTLPTLLVTPVSRQEIVLGKFLTVASTSVVSMILALISMVLTFTQGMKLSPELAEKIAEVVKFRFSVTDGIYGALILLPLAFFFSALLLSLGIFARSYREGQSYLTPVMFVVIFAAMGSNIPGIEGGGSLQLIPVLNASLALRSVFTGELELGVLALVVVENLILAGLSLLWASSMFQKEKVLFRI